MASTFLSKSISSTGNKQKMTFSAWVKGKIGSGTHCLFSTGVGGERSMILIEDGGKLQFSRYNGGYIWHLATNRRLRDCNSWYHIVCAFDTTQSTASDRAKIYINGVQETSLATSTYPSQNYEDGFNTAGKTQYVGQDSDGNFDFDGIMSHVHYIDGTAYNASTFGSTDATTGEWKINTNPTVTYGTNGFFLFKNDNAVTDRSGQGNNFTLGAGTLTKTEDNPSNVFCTINVLSLAVASMTIQSGNTAKRTQSGSNLWRTEYGTLGAFSGKYYWEFKIEQINSSDPNNFWIGIVDADEMYNGTSNHQVYKQARGYAYHGQTGNQGNNNSTSSYGTTYTAGDIIGVAMDLDNNKLYFHKNGTYQNSGVPTSGSTGTGAISISSGYIYLPAISQYYSDEKWSANFGNGDFNAGGISSAGTNASGNGIFEYDVPTGYTALSTKGLNL